MHRLIMSSNTYQMASHFDSAENEKIDPENRMLWRFRMQRLDAETLRDSILAVTGKLNRQVGGPPVFPKIDPLVLASKKRGTWKIQEEGPEVWRRSVYVYRRRGLPFPFFQLFDLPDQTVTCPQRDVSTVATQALTLLNNEFVLHQAELLAKRIAAEAGQGFQAQVAYAYQIVLSRQVTEEEKRLGLEFLEKRRQHHDKLGNQAALVGLSHVLLNLNEFVYTR